MAQIQIFHLMLLLRSVAFLQFLLLQCTNVNTYLVIAVIRLFCKMSVRHAPGKSHDTATIRLASVEIYSSRQKRCDCFTGNKD